MTTARVAVIQNMAGVTAGTFGAALSDAGATLEMFHPYDDGRLPAADADGDGDGDSDGDGDGDGNHDALLILGGVSNALDDDANPSFPALLDLIREFHRRNRPVLGICLGAQLIARAFDAAIHLGGTVEFGFKSLTATTEGMNDPVLGGLGASPRLLQWHTDHYDLPAGAVRLWRGETYPNQAIRLGRATYGLQSHPEATREMIAVWLDADKDIHRKVPDLDDWLPAEIDCHIEAQQQLCRSLATRWAALAKAG